MKERLKPILEVGIIAFGLYGLSFLAFSKELKERVRKEQKGICADCGTKPKKLEIHHIIPQSMGGADTRENAVGLCPECHEKWDELAFLKKIFYGKK